MAEKLAGVILENVNGTDIEVMPLTWSRCVLLDSGENLDEVLIKSPQMAQVGQILAVKAIDSSGKPLEWEVIDISKGSSGVSNYKELTNLPKINGVTLTDNKTAADLGLLENETDPTVPLWAKNATKPDYDWSEIKSKPTVITGGSQTSSSSVDGGINVYTFTRSDGTTSALIVKNGSKGDKGDKGENATTTAVASKSANGLCPKLPNETSVTKFLRQDGTWSIPPVSVTKSDIGLSNVENKSSATIRSELTSGNVADALGYTPVSGTYVKSGNIVGASSQISEYYDKANSSVYRYVNSLAKSICCDVAFKVGSKNVTAGSSATFADISAYKPTANVRAYIYTADYVICVLASSNGTLAVHVITGTVPSGTSLNARLEWHYV